MGRWRAAVHQSARATRPGDIRGHLDAEYQVAAILRHADVRTGQTCGGHSPKVGTTTGDDEIPQDKEYYCVNCGETPIPGKGFPSPCRAAPDGSHRVKYHGEAEYRVRSPSGEVHKSSHVPEGYTLVEKIVY